MTDLNSLKVCMVTAKIGNNETYNSLTDITYPRLKAYCEKYNIDFFNLTNLNGHINPYFVKLDIKNFLDRYDYVIWCDNDILVIDDSKHILSGLNLEDKTWDVAAFDHGDRNYELDEATRQRIIIHLNNYINGFDSEKTDKIINYDGSPCYNTGLMVINKGFLKLFDDPQIPELDILCWDQEIINYASLIGKIKVIPITEGFGNSPNDFQFNKKTPYKKHFLHFWGDPASEKVEKIKKYISENSNDRVVIPMRDKEHLKRGLRSFCEYLKKRGVKSIVEVGVHAGEGTEIFCEYFDLVFAVDPWENGYDTSNYVSQHADMQKVEAIFDSKKLPNVIKMKMTSREASKYINNVDAVYLDGNHSEEGVEDDYNAWKDKAKFIGGHDYFSAYPGVIDVVNRHFSNVITFEDTSWVEGKYSVSAVLIMKNEEEMIQKCLNSVKDFDEIIVVDTGSEDSSVEKVKELNLPNLKLIADQYKWNDNFAEARNFAKSFATSDYILSIDADQTLSSSYRDVVNTITGDDAYHIWNVYPNSGRHKEIRIFKNSKDIVWCDRVHNYISARYPKPSSIEMVSGYSPAHKKDPDRSLRILEKEVQERPTYARARYYYAREFWYRQDYDRAIQEFQEYLKYSKYTAEIADAQLYIARCYWLTRRGSLARKYCLNAIGVNPDFKEALLLMAEMSFEDNRKVWLRYAEHATNERVLFIRGE